VSWLRALDARFYAPAPAERLATLRLLSGAFALGYLLARAPVLADFRVAAGRFEPVGVAAWMNAPLAPALAFGLYLCALASGLAFTLGARFRISGPAFALLTLWVTSYRNSWGMIFHTENLLVIHLCVLAQSDAAAALSLDARKQSGSTQLAEHGRYGWPVRLISAATALSYCLAAIAKLKITGPSWMDGDVLRNYIAYDGMRKREIGSLHSPFGAWLVQYSWPFPLLSVLTFVLELSGPVALLVPALARIWALGIWGFHVGVFASMAIAFPHALSGVAFASVFRCERLWQLRGFARVRAWLLRKPGGVVS
jgi:Vitamin K-dependent gamma-carboxylase